MLKIGEFSKLSRVSIRMLRRYNEVGLLLPAEIDPITGYRYYSEDQLPAAGRITALRDMGFGLAAIEQLLATWEEPVALEAILDAKQAQLQEEAALAQRRLRALETLRQRLRKEDNAMDYTVNLKTLPQRQAACLRMTIPTYDQEGTLDAGDRSFEPPTRRPLLLQCDLPRWRVQRTRRRCRSPEDRPGAVS